MDDVVIGAKTLLVLRHGQTEHNASGIYQGHTDTDLSALGWQQAAGAADTLARRGPVRIVSSDLRRAHNTARALGAATGVDVEIEPDLREIDVGTWAGLSHLEVEERYPDVSRDISAGFDARRGEHGETVAEVGTRTARVCERVAALMEPRQVAVLVTHGIAARAMTAAVLGWPVNEAAAHLSRLENCRCAELRQDSCGWSLASWNSRDVPTATRWLPARWAAERADLEAGA